MPCNESGFTDPMVGRRMFADTKVRDDQVIRFALQSTKGWSVVDFDCWYFYLVCVRIT